MKKLLVTFVVATSLISSVSYAAGIPKIETKVFVGQLSIDKNKAVLENISPEELAKVDPSFNPNKEVIIKKQQKKRFSSEDLSINLKELPAEINNELIDKCGDGQLCRITASIQKDKPAQQEDEPTWALKVKKIEMIRE